MKGKIPFSKKSIVFIVTAILIVTISLTIQPKDNPNIFERCINTVFLPVQMVVKWPYNKVAGAIDFFSGMKYYAEENEKLKNENIMLKEEVRQLENAGVENGQLRDLLNLKNKYSMANAVVAEIISFDSSPWFEVFTVNKGSNAGVKKNMTVLTPNGLVGKVTQVFDYTSQVTSILDVSNAVSARLTKTGEQVITKGDMYLAAKGMLKLNYITSDTLLSEGDVIETSGVGGIYPKGIFIGTINKIEEDASAMKTYAIVEPGVDFGKIGEVLIISNSEGE